MSTWEDIEGWGKAHPVALGLIVFAIGFVFIYYLWGSSTPAPAAATGPSDAYYNAAASIAASGNALQAQQLQVQQQANQTAADLSAVQSNNATAVQVEQIKANATTTVGAQQQESQDFATQAQQESTDLASTLSAQVAGKQSDNAVVIANINAGAADTQAQIAANTTVQTTALNAQVQESSYQAQVQTAGIQTAGAVQIAGIQTAGATQIAQIQTSGAVQADQIAANTVDYLAAGSGFTGQVSGGGYSYAPTVISNSTAAGTSQIVANPGASIGLLAPGTSVNQWGPYGLAAGAGGYYNAQGQFIIPA